MSRSFALLALLTFVALAPACADSEDADSGSDESPTRALQIDVGSTVSAAVTTRCGFEWLEVEINGLFWSTDELKLDAAGNPVEPAWPTDTATTQLDLTLVDPGTLKATAPGSRVTHTYRPVADRPGCE
jgi:hypothetical protein